MGYWTIFNNTSKKFNKKLRLDGFNEIFTTTYEQVFSHEQGEQIKKAYNEMLKIRATMLQEELLNLLK